MMRPTDNSMTDTGTKPTGSTGTAGRHPRNSRRRDEEFQMVQRTNQLGAIALKLDLDYLKLGF